MVAHGQGVEEAKRLMLGFADRTGVSSERPAQRYLWTDAFAVCNLLALAETTGERRFVEYALALVDQVHHVLGRHRPDAGAKGWISGLDEPQGEAHPTRGGLRIGKPLPERRPEEAFDERIEWERDGQYFHYLTKWMLALDQLSRATRERRFHLWACELAVAAHDAFTIAPGDRGRPRMVWKMSGDLSRPLVASMGHHDPLDGMITCLQLQATAAGWSGAPAADLARTAVSFQRMIEGVDFTTADPLGIGGLLMDACHLSQLLSCGAPRGDLLDELLAAAERGVALYARRPDLHEPASRRLAFRELGLAIGLRGLPVMERQLAVLPERASAPAARRLETLRRYAPLGEAIVSYWLDSSHRRSPTGVGHRDINEVMLAASLIPQGCLILRAPV